MYLTPNSYNGHAINDGVDFEAFFPDDASIVQSAPGITYVSSPSGWPMLGYLDKKERAFKLVVEMRGGAPGVQVDVLKAWFDVRDQTERKLLCTDDTTGLQWYLMCKVKEQAKTDRAQVTFVLIASDPLWRTEVERTDNWAIAVSGAVHDVVAGGNIEALPTITVRPTLAKAGGFTYKRFCSVYNNLDVVLADYPIDITGGGLNTAALVGAGKMQADGDDVRVYVDGVETDRWLQGMNGAATKIWATITWQPRKEFALATAIAGAGAITTIDLESTKATGGMWKNLPTAGTVLIGTELFTYTSKGFSATGDRRLNGVTRAAFGTAAGAHVAGVTVRWIEHEIWLYYGDATLGAPTVDDTLRPMFDLTSTNAQWNFTSMFYVDGDGAYHWSPVVVTGHDLTVYYTGNQEATADPAVEMGMTIGARLKKGRWQGEDGIVEWFIYVPTGVTTVSSNGEKWRNSDSWPAIAALQYSPDGKTWTNEWNEATPALPNVWTAWNHAAAALGGTYEYLRLYFAGAIQAGEDFRACFECEAISLTLGANVPTVSPGAELTTIYELDCILENVTTGEWIRLHRVLNINDAVIVNCEGKTVVLESDGTNCLYALSVDNVADEWITLEPGGNAWRYTEAGLAGVTVAFGWRDRNN